jgi:hypothetical protein
MASKTGKKANAAAKSKDQRPVPKDDGSRWIVVRHGRPVYPSHGGTTLAHAQQLEAGLLEPAELIQVNIEPEQSGSNESS